MSDVPSTAAARVRQLLLERGVAEERIARATEEHQLHLLVVDALVVSSEPRYTAAEVADLSGVELDQLRRLWRALGFPDLPETEPCLTEDDLEAMTTVSGLVMLSRTDDNLAVELARVIGSSVSRIAEAHIDSVPHLRAEMDPAERAELFALTADATMPGIVRLLDYSWRRHLQAAARRAMLWRLGADRGVHLTVGFADLVGFTALSQQLSQEALARVVARFEQVAHETVTATGGRVVKMIGDEVMFVVGTEAEGAHIALALAEAFAGDDELSDVRVGLASGQVLAREGDYYGPVVNLASRIVNIARPGSVVVSENLHLALLDDPRFAWRTIRPRYLKDIGRVRLWALLRAKAGTGAAPLTGKPGVLGLLNDGARERLERSRR